MAIRIKFDSTHNVIQPTFALATRSGHKIGPVPAYNISISDSFNSNFDLEFKVDKFDNGEEYKYWDKLTDFKLLWCKEWNVWFEIYVTISDDNDTVKNIQCVSLCEAELSQINLYNTEINTEDDIARDDYAPTVLYNADKPNASLLHRILQKAPHYTIKHVDQSVSKIQRTFSFNNTSIYDALQDISEEIDCLFVFDSETDEDGEISRSISVYDLEYYCTECGHRDTKMKKCTKCGSENILRGYGSDTGIFISTENLADNITLKTDTNSVKNCFKLEGGDDLMTATIISCNPNGSQYIWYISDELKEDMSDELVSMLKKYDDEYAYYNNKYTLNIPDDILSSYNDLVNKYHPYNEDLHTISKPITGYPALMNAYYDTIDMYLFLHDSFMPSPELSSTTAEAEAAKLTSVAMSPIAVQDLSKCSSSTASIAALSMAKTIVDSRYQVKVKNGILEDEVWTGNFTITNYSDETDTADSELISITISDNYELFTKQKLDKILSKSDNKDVTDISGLFKLELEDFKSEIKKYCLTSLNSFCDSCQSCLDILVEQGIADRDTWANQNPDLYTALYLDYYNKLLTLQDEIKIREAEIAIVVGALDADGDIITDGLQTCLSSERSFIQDKLNMENFIGKKLWLEFIAYRREDTYNNDNYISDGLDNSEIFDRALKFIETAKKEIYKSATKQHSISASLKNLLVIEEFEPIIDYFSVGNWIHVGIDDEVYALRLISYSIDFDDLDNISIEFSDVEKYSDTISDSESIMKQASSMASSYDAVTRQASQGKKSNAKLEDWVTNGLSLTKMKIIDNADNQNVSWDSHGILCREYLPITDEYSDKQLKIINRGLYLTDDNWLTSKAGIGDFTYYNPETGQMEESYGVIADVLVGNLILSEKIGIYNTKNSITMGEDGLIITTDSTSPGVNTMALTVQKKTLDADNNEVITPVMYLDGDGNLVMTGSLHIQASADDSVNTLNDLCDMNRFSGKIAEAIHAESQTIYNSIDERYRDVLNDATNQLENYKADLGQYLQFNGDGLTLGAITSDFKTIIDNRGMYFKEGDTTVAYINNNQLYIPNAVIEKSLVLGKFFFAPHSNEDGGVSLTWQG